MPISIIEKKIFSNLAKIDFETRDIKYKPSSTLKRSILHDTNISIEIVAKNKFHIYIKFIDFHEILINNFYYNNRRFKIQIRELNKLKDSQSIAWLLITMYYGAFFASNEIANLAGYFNLNFEQNEKYILFNKNVATDSIVALEFKESDNKNFFGEMSLCDEPNTIKISCTNGGGKPHELSWRNLAKLLNFDSSDSDVIARARRFKKIMTNDKKWKRPNSIRNEWNYGKAELYTEDNKEDLANIQKYFNRYAELKRWAEIRQEYSNGMSDDIVSIMFILNILEKVMDKLETKLLSNIHVVYKSKKVLQQKNYTKKRKNKTRRKK